MEALVRDEGACPGIRLDTATALSIPQVGTLAPIHPSAGEQHTYTRKSLQGILHSPSSVALDAKKHMFNQFFEADVPLPSPSGR
ncbi:hypothetical protein HaLaN_16620, partial [Haematococcus lacustris]